MLNFAEFLKYYFLNRLSIFYQSTCVGLQYGNLVLKVLKFLFTIIKLYNFKTNKIYNFLNNSKYVPVWKSFYPLLRLYFTPNVTSPQLPLLNHFENWFKPPVDKKGVFIQILFNFATIMYCVTSYSSFLPVKDYKLRNRIYSTQLTLT